MKSMMITDYSFYDQLLQIDIDLACEVRQKGCPYCGDVLHSANFPRCSKGLPESFGKHKVVRFSFCCSADCCRRRVTPASVRFLGRKRYISWIVLILSFQSKRVQRGSQGLQTPLRPSARTLARWRCWWQESVPGTRFWKYARGLIPSLSAASDNCGELIRTFSALESCRGMIQLMRFIMPLSCGENGVNNHAIWRLQHTRRECQWHVEISVVRGLQYQWLFWFIGYCDKFRFCSKAGTRIPAYSTCKYREHWLRI